MQELDIRAIAAVLLRKLKWLILSAVVLALAFGLYAKFFVQNTYCSQTQMYVSNYTNLDQAQGASSSGLSASQLLVNEYIVILKNDAVVNRVCEQLREQGNGYTVTPAAVRGATAMTSVDETAMLNIAVTTTDPELSKAICDAYSAVAPDLLKEVMEMGTIKPMAPAQVGVKVGPNIIRCAFIGGAIGLLLAVVIVVMTYMFDNRVTGERELKRRLNVTVLGEVPDLQPMKKGESKNGKN